MTKLLIVKAKPKLYLKKPSSQFRQFFYSISLSKKFERFIVIMIVLNSLFLVLVWPG